MGTHKANFGGKSWPKKCAGVNEHLDVQVEVQVERLEAYLLAHLRGPVR